MSKTCSDLVKEVLVGDYRLPKTLRHIEDTFVDREIGRTTCAYEGKKVNLYVIKVMGIKLVSYAGKLLILDFSATNQMYQCLNYWKNITVYTGSYNLCGTSADFSMQSAIKKFFAWVSNIEREYYLSIPKHIKHTLAIMQNDLGNLAETLATGYKERREQLFTDYRAKCWVSNNDFYKFVTSLRISNAAKIDMCSLLHGFPSPDADVTTMFGTVTKKLSQSNRVDHFAFNRFVNYCRSFDLVEFLRVYRGDNPFSPGKRLHTKGLAFAPGKHCSAAKFY